MIRSPTPVPTVTSSSPSRVRIRACRAWDRCRRARLRRQPGHRDDGAGGVAFTTSRLSVPFTTTVSAWRSLPPRLDERSTSTALTFVAERSFTVTLSAPPSVRMSTVSMPSASWVTLATSRWRLRRSPLAARSMFSPMLEPLKASVSLPAWPSRVSLPSPGFQVKVSSPAAEEGGVGAAGAVDLVVAVAAEDGVGAVASGEGVVAVAAVDRERREGREAVRAGDRVVAAEARDHQALDRRDHAHDHRAGSRDGLGRAVEDDLDRVVAARAVVAGGVGALAAVERDRHAAGDAHGRGEGVVPAEAGDDDRVERLAAADDGLRGQPVDRQRCSRVAELHAVAVVGAVDEHGVDRAVGGPPRLGVDGLRRRSVEIAHGDRVGAAEGADVDGLDAVGVLGDVGDVAVRCSAVAVGREIDVLADVGAVELRGCRCRPGLRGCRCRRRGSR